MSRKQKGKAQDQDLDKDYKEKIPAAFILCHRMENSLIPITAELPPCLFPLCNSPVLLYVLNWLNINDFEKIYILCGKDDEHAIAKVVDQCRSRMLMDSIEILSTMEPIFTICDSIRWIDKWNKDANAFKYCAIVPGTLVTNAPLSTIMHNFMERVRNTKSSAEFVPVMNAVFSQGNANNSYTVVTDPEGMITQLQPLTDLPINISPEIDNPLMIGKITDKPVKIKTGVTDSHIYICTEQLLANFEESFDWQSIFNDCIPSHLKNADVLGHAIFSTFIQKSFVATIDDLPSYLNATLAVIRRWIYPVTIEMNFFTPSITESLLYAEDDENESSVMMNSPCGEECALYKLDRDLVYSAGVLPPLNAKVGHSVVLGSGTKLHDKCVIKNSSIGRNCEIGEGAVITDCIIWDNVVIGKGAHITKSVLASNVQVAPDVTIEWGCTISFSVEVGCNIPCCRRLSTQTSLTSEGVFQSAVDPSHYHVPYAPDWLQNYVKSKPDIPDLQSEGTFAYEFCPTPSAELPLLHMWLDEGYDNFPIDLDEVLNSRQLRTNDDYDGSFEEDEGSFDEEEDADFINLDDSFAPIADDCLIGAVLSNKSASQIESEFVSLKATHDAEHIDCAAALMRTIISEFPDFKVGFALLGDLLSKFVEESEEQVDFLFWLLQHCAKEKIAAKDYISYMRTLYEKKFISQSSYQDWVEQNNENIEDLSKGQKILFDEFVKECSDIIE